MEYKILEILKNIVNDISEEIIKESDRDEIKFNINKNNSISFFIYGNVLLKINFLKTKTFIEIRKVDILNLESLKLRFDEVKCVDILNLESLKLKFDEVKCKEDDLYIKIYIKNIEEIKKIKEELKNICIYLYFNKPVEQFGCCSRYIMCSDLLKCIHPDKNIARGCQYKENLENGKIFYGINRNVGMNKSTNIFGNLKHNYSREFKGNSLLNLCEDYVLVDIETTGFSPENDDIIEIAAMKVKNNEIIDQFQSLIKIEDKLSDRVSNLTGITDEMLINGKNIKEVLISFKEFIQDDVLVGHNINFDINFLYDKYKLYMDEYLENDFIDTLRIAKRMLPNLANYKLSTLAKYFEIDYLNAHRGLEDVKITYKVYNKLKYYEENYKKIV